MANWPAANAGALRAVLEGKPGPYRDVVLFNAAAALLVAGKAKTLREGVALAAQSIDSGKARVAERGADGGWKVNQWLKKAVLLSFRLNDMTPW